MKRRTQIISFFLLAVSVSSFSLSAAKVFAVDTTFYSGNNILFYNPDDTSCSSSTIATTGDNKADAYNFLVSKGLTAIQSAAVVGNLQQESNVNPRAENPSSGAYGIAQWLGGRKTKLMAKDFYQNPDESKEMQVQLDYLWEELQGSEKKSLDALKAGSTTDVRQLSIVFGEVFERYGNGEEGRRAEYAESIFKQYGGSATTSTSSGASGCTNQGAGDFTYFSQKDDKWGSVKYGDSNILESGCAPTSLAMIIATKFDKNAKPDEVAKLGEANGSYISGVGTAHVPLLEAGKKKWGFNYKNISNEPFDVAIEAVKAGNLVYMGGQGSAPFTGGGHVVVMRGMTNDGKVIIGDPYRGASDTYDVATVSTQRGSTYVISK